MKTILVRHAQTADRLEWLRMRQLLWPDQTAAEHLAEIDQLLTVADQSPVFVAVRPTGQLGGFLEGGTRPYADGCDTSPVGYLEGWYVDADLRRQGVGKLLVEALEAWARAQGLSEMGSDTWLENEISLQAHAQLGYILKERLAHFAKKL